MTIARPFVKTISYRTFMTIILGILAFVYTKNLDQTSYLVIYYTIIGTGVYFIHEWIWNKTNYLR
jgi:uncharacterized membrane protein